MKTIIFAMTALILFNVVQLELAVNGIQTSLDERVLSQSPMCTAGVPSTASVSVPKNSPVYTSNSY